jgi:glycosyltransferase involved in cell wall biosynthesis
MELAGHELRDLMSRAALRVFDWSDDFAAFDTDEPERLRTENRCEQVLRASDVVLAVNHELGRRARAYNANVHVVRNGTDPSIIGQALDDRYPRAKALVSAKPPVVGYVGYRVADRLDVELIEYLAANRPDWTFAFVGPRVGDEPLADVMRRHANVRVFDAVEYRGLPAYFAAFDACILPNRLNEHTRGNDPIKIYDYLASGRPVVTTRTAGSEQFAGAIETAASHPEFLAALDRVLAGDSPAARQRRLAVARENSWQARVDVVSKILRDAIG